MEEATQAARTQPPLMKDATCQTSKEISTQTVSAPQQSPDEFVIPNEPFLAFLIETLVTTEQACDLGQKCVMATTAYRKHLGKAIDPNRLKQLMMNNDKQPSITNKSPKQAPPPTKQTKQSESNTKENSNYRNGQQ
jgi:hypothetical protein